MTIHPTAVIDPKAEIDSDVTIGHYVVIEGPVKVKRGSRIMAHAYLTGWTEIGENNEIHPGAVLGDAPQDRAYKGEETYLKIGDYALMRGLSGTSRDVPPYSIVDWQHTVRGVNVVGLKRAGFDERRIREIRETYRILFRKGRNLSLAIKEIEEKGRANADVSALLDFIKWSKRGVCVGA